MFHNQTSAYIVTQTRTLSTDRFVYLRQFWQWERNCALHCRRKSRCTVSRSPTCGYSLCSDLLHSLWFRGFSLIVPVNWSLQLRPEKVLRPESSGWRAPFSGGKAKISCSNLSWWVKLRPLRPFDQASPSSFVMVFMAKGFLAWRKDFIKFIRHEYHLQSFSS